MKLLIIYTEHFAYQPAHKTLDDQPDCTEPGVVTDAVVGLIHVEPADSESSSRVATKLVKNLKWAARKNETRRIVLHSFSHLAEEKADAVFTKELLNRSEERLRQADYDVWQTPFGYFLDLDLKAPGLPTARIFISI